MEVHSIGFQNKVLSDILTSTAVDDTQWSAPAVFLVTAQTFLSLREFHLANQCL